MKRFILTLALIVALSTATSRAQYNPHPKTVTYTEDFRGQFHFSPKSGWMNDINALMYHDGKYHMIYLWGKNDPHGGYATSKDLLHWTDEGVALIPQDSLLPKEAIRNVSGSKVYSGSGVVVSGPVAEKITGSPKEAMIAIYTGTKSGTCLAWSNDGGTSWHDYKANPVANPTNGTAPRDPHVFWYEPTGEWIMAIFENRTTFYGSKDLIEWKRLSNIKFGQECPDIYELPLDGNKSKMKWVLQDAKGSYLVGQFDGKQFMEEQGKMVMDVGNDFYAGQTFYRPNFPRKELIQIAWNDHWNGGVGEQGWERNATFPVAVGLVTYDGKMRVTRTPIEDIKKLYQGQPVWLKEGTIKPGENILKDVRSKAFDMTAVFDLNDTKATSIDFQIAQVTFAYDITNQQMCVGLPQGKGKNLALKPDEKGILTVRILVDWAQLEVFSAGGVFSASYQLGFTPDDSTVGLTSTGGDVKLVSLELNEVGSIWTASASCPHCGEPQTNRCRRPSHIISSKEPLRSSKASDSSKPAVAAESKPNVLFIAIDDMNDWTTLFDKGNPIKTPNLERLAARGMFFSRGYCAAPACNPSRASIMTGYSPVTSGCYNNGSKWWITHSDAVTIPQYFRNNGYLAKGAGKIFHHGGPGGGNDPRGTEHSWDDFQNLVPTRAPKESYNGYQKGMPGVGGLARTDWDWGEHDQKMVDEYMLEKVSAIIDEKWDKPMFLAAGIFKPHLPFYAPPEVFKKYPMDDVVLPKIPENDLDDVSEVAKNMAHTEFFVYNNVTKHEAPDPRSLKRMVQCYQASADYSDSVLGRLLDKLDASGRADNTIIVLWADHGYHLGDKESCVKFTLWEKANHVPFIIVAPGVTKPGSRCDKPVSLLDIYPTLLELAGLPPKADNDGYSLVPLLKNPKSEWKHVPIMTMGRCNNAVRTERWRYIRYHDGSQELYDHDQDPWEWTNLEGQPEYAEVIRKLQSLLPVDKINTTPKRKER